MVFLENNDTVRWGALMLIGWIWSKYSLIFCVILNSKFRILNHANTLMIFVNRLAYHNFIKCFTFSQDLNLMRSHLWFSIKTFKNLLKIHKWRGELIAAAIFRRSQQDIYQYLRKISTRFFRDPRMIFILYLVEILGRF